MGEQVIRQPNGAYAIYSSHTKTILAWDMTPDDIINRAVTQAADQARDNITTQAGSASLTSRRACRPAPGGQLHGGLLVLADQGKRTGRHRMRGDTVMVALVGLLALAAGARLVVKLRAANTRLARILTDELER